MLWIANGVDTDHFKPMHDTMRSTTRTALGLAANEVVFGCVASLNPVKRHVDLVQAFASVHQRNSRTRLLLIGDGSLKDSVREQVRSLGLDDVVTLLGSRPDVETVLPALDVAMLASSSEGMSNALLEAMSCGLPIIATAVGGNQQLVCEGRTGRLVPAFDPEAMAAAMLELADSPLTRRRFGAAGRERIEQSFSLGSMAQSYDCLYRRLLGRP
jgi:glycosyltransferase involved in cell wall biosynthesis